MEEILSTTVENLSARLTLIARQFGGVAGLARTIGVSDNAIYKWLAGRGPPSLASVVAIARAAGVSIEWLATGREGASGSVSGTQIAGDGDYALMPRGEVRFGAGRGGRLRNPLIVDALAFHARWLERRLDADPMRLMLLEMSGDSMAPTLRAGDLVLADLRRDRARAAGLYVLRERDNPIVKRIQRRRLGRRLTILSDNRAYQPIELPARSVNIVGQVIWIGKAI